MDFYGYEFVRESDLRHYGLKGMHWGTRRWQNPDGTFNAAGKQRYFGRGTGEDYHPVGRSSSGGQSSGASRSSGNLGGAKRSFDGGKAKKIAKGVAIGAAVVGGTVLVAYGAKHLKDTGVLDKLPEGKIVAERIGNTMGAVTTKSIQATGKAAQRISDFAKSDKAAEIGNAVGKATTKTLQTTGKAAKKVYDIATSEQAKQAYKNVAKTAGETAKKAYKAATSEQAKEGYKKAAQVTGQVAKKAYKAATSEQTKNAVKKTATATKNGVKTAASITKSTIEVAKLASQHPQETKAAVDYTKQLLQNMQGISAANARNGQAVSKSNATEQYNAQTLARQYRRDHPNTKLSNREIVRNMGYGL